MPERRAGAKGRGRRGVQTDWEGLRTGDWRSGRPATAPVAPGTGSRLGQTADTKAECNRLTSVLDWVCSNTYHLHAACGTYNFGNVNGWQGGELVSCVAEVSVMVGSTCGAAQQLPPTRALRGNSPARAAGGDSRAKVFRRRRGGIGAGQGPRSAERGRGGKDPPSLPPSMMLLTSAATARAAAAASAAAHAAKTAGRGLG